MRADGRPTQGDLEAWADGEASQCLFREAMRARAREDVLEERVARLEFQLSQVQSLSAIGKLLKHADY